MIKEDTRDAFWRGRLEEAMVLAGKNASDAWYCNDDFTSGCIKLLMYMFACTHPELFFIKRWWYTYLGWRHAQSLYKKREKLKVAQLEVLAQFFIGKCAGVFGRMLFASHLEEVLCVKLIPSAEGATIGIKHRALVYTTIAEGAALLGQKQVAKTYVSSAINLIVQVDRGHLPNSASYVVEVFHRAALVEKSLGRFLKARDYATFAYGRVIVPGPSYSPYQARKIRSLLDECEKVRCS